MNPTNARRQIRALRDLGWNVTVAGSGHIICRHPDGAHVVYGSATPGDWRSWYNLLAKLKRSLRAGEAKRRDR